MNHYHAVIWVDHREAHVIRFGKDEAESALVHARGGDRQIHHRSGSITGRHGSEAPDFFRKVAEAVKGSSEVLLTGPAAAKLHLYDWWKKHDAPTAAKVVGIESADHPSDGQLLKHARAYFDAQDRMRPQA